MKKWLVIVPALVLVIWGPAWWMTRKNKGDNASGLQSIQLNESPTNIDQVAGKSRDEVEEVLGEPIKVESINPTSTPCPCDKLTYRQDTKIEIVYINGLSDWITVYRVPRLVTGSNDKYLSVDQFSRYTYVKVKTP